MSATYKQKIHKAWVSGGYQTLYNGWTKHMSARSGQLLSYLIYKYDYLQNLPNHCLHGHQLDGDWFTCSRQEIEYALSVNRRAGDTSMKQLRELGLVSIHRTPNGRRIEVHIDKLVALGNDMYGRTEQPSFATASAEYQGITC